MVFFQPDVATEDATKLLHNTIAMFDELSYVFDVGTSESGRETVKKAMFHAYSMRLIGTKTG